MRVAHFVGVATTIGTSVNMLLKAKVHKPHFIIKVTEFLKRKQVQPIQVQFARVKKCDNVIHLKQHLINLMLFGPFLFPSQSLLLLFRQAVKQFANTLS